MAKDDRDILRLLKEELDFIEKGGYQRSAHLPWLSKSAFQDSLTCVNYGYPYRAHPCNECHLLDFVSLDHQRELNPCHFIPLNESGETIASLEGDEQKLEHTIKQWLLVTIDGIEEERSQLAMAGCP